MSPRRSKRIQSRYPQQTAHNGNLQGNSNSTNISVPEQLAKAQALYGLRSVYTVHRDKLKVQRYSPPPVELPGEF